MIYPDYKELCTMTPEEGAERIIEEDWINKCWYSNEHAHGYYLTWEHRQGSQRNVNKRWQDENNIWAYYNKLKSAQKRYQKIDLSTSLQFYRKMTPQNDTFKMHRCKAMVA
eukprot:4625096-Amphidinium_carterae.1